MLATVSYPLVHECACTCIPFTNVHAVPAQGHRRKPNGCGWVLAEPLQARALRHHSSKLPVSVYTWSIACHPLTPPPQPSAPPTSAALMPHLCPPSFYHLWRRAACCGKNALPFCVPLCHCCICLATDTQCANWWSCYGRGDGCHNGHPCYHHCSIGADPSGRLHLWGGTYIHFWIFLPLHLQNCTVNCPSKVDVLVQSPYYSGYPSIVGLVGTAQWNSTANPASPYTIKILTWVH